MKTIADYTTSFNPFVQVFGFIPNGEKLEFPELKSFNPFVQVFGFICTEHTNMP